MTMAQCQCLSHLRMQSQGTSTSEGSPSGTVSHEYSIVVQTPSYTEIWSKIHQRDGDGDGELTLEQVLQPNRECVEEALRHAQSNTLTRLVSDYFRHTETATQLCLLLHCSVNQARDLYAPLHQLLDVFEDLSLNHTQCTHALNVFLQFDRHDNPFPSPDSHPDLDDTRRLLSDLKQNLDRRLRKARRLRRATLVCLIATAVGVVGAAAAAITGHALTTAAAFVPLCMCSRSKEDMKQLDAAAKGTCVLNGYLGNIDMLARRLHTAVESDKHFIRLGLERGAQDKHPIQEVLKQLRKGHPNFLQLLNELDQQICLCFNTINRARSQLLQHIYTTHPA